MQRVLLTEDEAMAQEKARSIIYDLIYEGESGMPAITQWLRPADEV